MTRLLLWPAIVIQASYTQTAATDKLVTGFLLPFFSLSSAILRESIGPYVARMQENPASSSHTPRVRHARWENKGRGKSGISVPCLRKAYPIPRSSPASLTFPSGPIPISPAYTSVKVTKSGTIANGKRLHSGRKAYTAGDGLTTVRNSFDHGSAIVRQLLGFASVFSRSIAEGLSKASRTLVEALSKDCRTSLEQQSNNCRRNIEESYTHAKGGVSYRMLKILVFIV